MSRPTSAKTYLDQAYHCYASCPKLELHLYLLGNSNFCSIWACKLLAWIALA